MLLPEHIERCFPPPGHSTLEYNAKQQRPPAIEILLCRFGDNQVFSILEHSIVFYYGEQVDVLRQASFFFILSNQFVGLSVSNGSCKVVVSFEHDVHSFFSVLKEQ